MKKLMLAISAMMLVVLVNAQDEVKPAAPGVVYGTVTEKGEAIKVTELNTKMKDDKYEGKVTGKVTEVCKAMGCWIKLELADGKTIMVKAKDHSFTMPQDIVGKTVVVDGEAKSKEISEAMRKHYAEDGGKSKEEINKIKGSTKEVMIAANGVKVL